jgi:hypothetical protein
MPRPCSICTHPNREAIDKALVIERASLRDIARRFGATKDSLSRHRPHIATALTKAHEAAEVSRADTLLDRVKSLCERSEGLVTSAEEVLEDARKAKDGRTALDAIRTAAVAARELRSNLSLLGELTGEMRKPQEGSTVRAVILMPGPRLPPGAPSGNLSIPEYRALPPATKGEVIDAECEDATEEPENPRKDAA